MRFLKPGITTTEFWLTLTAAIVTLFGTLSDLVAPDLAAGLVTIQSVVYALSRGLAKSATPPPQ